MWRIGWIDPAEYSFDCMLLMERFQIRMMLENLGDEGRPAMAAALKGHPEVARFFQMKCPETAETVAALTASAPEGLTGEQLRAAEITILGGFEDFVIYTTPEQMAEKCDFIYGWRKERLFEICDLSGKTALDVGAGTGRLAFAAAERAAFITASEPVNTLREFMRDEIQRKGIRNMRVCDGLCDCLPFPDSSFDVVMSGHVVGDRFREEIAELTRVARPGGWLLDVPGDQRRETEPNRQLLADGWEELPYPGAFGGTTYRYRKQVKK